MRLILFFIFYYFFLFLYSMKFLSFSILEVESIKNFWPLKYILEFSFYLFGKNDFALRFPQLLFSLFSIVLIYKIAQKYFSKRNDIDFSIIIFSLIPGFIVSTLIVNKAIYLIFLTLLLICFYESFFIYVLLAVYSVIDSSFIVLYIGVFAYAIYKKKNLLIIMSLLFLAVNANFFHYTIGGKPKGYFLDVIGTYTLIFSPFVFIYFLYSLYKGFFYKKDIVFFISINAFLLSIIFSFRQRIKIDDYASFVLPYVLYMVKIFLSSYRVRLPRFRKGYKILFIVLLFTMFMFDAVLFLNKYTPARNLSGSFYFIKDLAKILKKKKINNIYCNNVNLCKALYFYGIKNGKSYFILYSKSKAEVSILHKKKKIMNIDVSKINTL
ncbi:glycosyltransferase family 39 protein [Caminibacter sp.]